MTFPQITEWLDGSDEIKCISCILAFSSVLYLLLKITFQTNWVPMIFFSLFSRNVFCPHSQFETCAWKISLVPLISKSFSLFSPADLASYSTGKHSSPETRSHAFRNIFFLSLLWSFHAHLYVKVVSLAFMKGSLYSFFLLSNSTGMEGITWEQCVWREKGRKALAASWQTATCLSLVCFDCFIFSLSSYPQEYTYCVMELWMLVA